ncbi:hypothetical protein FBU30_003035 [Linnemannia zychae]|nr:hypothetical protein FBU30_003035 [Linnemannia zychae]
MDIDTPSPTTARSDMTAQTTISPKQRKPYSKSSTSASSSASTTNRPNSRGVRMTFELDDVLRKYTPEEFKTCKGYDVGGVNILNKKPLDSKTALDKITRRRETHNRVERRRRDCINQLIDELTELLPKDDDDSVSKGHRVNILRNVVRHIQDLTRHNENLNKQLQALQAGATLSPPTIITTPAPPPTIHSDANNSNISDTGPSPSPHTSYDTRSQSTIQSLESSPQLGSSFHSDNHHRHYSGPQHQFTTLQSSNSERIIDNPRSLSPPSLPSLNDMALTLPAIPQIIEPSDSDQYHHDQSLNLHSKRMNRQTLPRLQLLPPPSHLGHPNNHLNSPSSPSYRSHPSPASSYSESGPWSTTSSYGPFSAGSPSGSISYSPGGPISPYSPHGPPSTMLSTSPSGYSHSRSPLFSPRLSPWDKSDSPSHNQHSRNSRDIDEQQQQSIAESRWCNPSNLQQHTHSYKSDRHPEVS